MRLAIVWLLAACTEHGKGGGGVLDGGASLCAPAPELGCATGPKCGNACCDEGERCVDGACTCNFGARCTDGEVCAAGGPAGGEVCGVTCCGSTGNPCPLVTGVASGS